MLAHGFDAVERDGLLRFANRRGDLVRDIASDNLAVAGEDGGGLQRSRAPMAEMAGRVRVGFVEAEGDYAARIAEAVLPDEATRAVAGSDLPLLLTGAEGRQVAERWLAEARIARDMATFTLPPSIAVTTGPGDVVRIEDTIWRIDRAETGLETRVEAVRIDPETYRPQDAADDLGALPPVPPVVPVEALFLDLPLMRGDEVPHAPHVAMTARPWPGPVALYDSAQDGDYVLNRLVETPAVIGTTLTPMFRAPAGRWDRGPALRVRLVRGALSTVAPEAVLAGANLAAIGDGLSDRWELFQFVEAELVAPLTWDLRLRLRGQAGTDGVMPEDWPPGSRVVLIDRAVRQIDLPPSARGLERHFRFGPAARPLGDPSYRHRVLIPAGNGLRPYSVAHLRVAPSLDGLRLTWVRRTRIGGDGWEAAEVPLGEGTESYVVRVTAGGIVRREVVVSAPAWTYTPAMIAADGVAGAVVLSVAQLSDQVGPGPFRDIEAEI
jgi:hypothetical protein